MHGVYQYHVLDVRSVNQKPKPSHGWDLDMLDTDLDMAMLSVLATTLGEPQFHALDVRSVMLKPSHGWDLDMLVLHTLDWSFPHLTLLTLTLCTLPVLEYALTTSVFKFHANLPHATLPNF